jgi:hypothetical protein
VAPRSQTRRADNSERPKSNPGGLISAALTSPPVVNRFSSPLPYASMSAGELPSPMISD